MQDFTFQNETKLIFGRDKEKEVGHEVAPYSKSVLLVYGSDRIKRTGLYDTVVRSLEKENISHMDLSGVQPNPRLSLVYDGIDMVRKNDIGFILAIGGGSPIDTAKAIAVGVPYDGDVWDLFKGEPVKEAMPTGCVLTYPAAGSEASVGSVITNEEGWYKRPLGDVLMRPRFAILNPELTLSVPKDLTAIGVADIMSHLMERYFTRVRNTDLTDELIEGTLRAVIRNTHKVMADPGDIDARSEIMLASTYAHNDFFTVGRVGDWASHNIEHELSGIYDIPHGAGLSIIMPAWMRYVYKEDLFRFVDFAREVFDVESNSKTDDEIAREGIERLKAFYDEIGLPTRLEQVDIDSSRVEEMAEKCTESAPQGNFKKLQKEDVVEILKLAL